MKINTQSMFCIIATFSFGYLVGYLTLYLSSPSFHNALILYGDARANSSANSDYSRVAREVHNSHILERRAKDYAEAAVDKSSTIPGGYSYLLVLYYLEQMNNALSNLLRLGPVAMNLDLRIVEPFAVHSRLYGLPGMLPHGEVAGTFYSLRTLFKIDSINQSLFTYGNASLVSFEYFVLNAPRDVVVVYFIHNEGPRPRSFRLSYRYLRILKLVTESATSVVDCTSAIVHEEQIYSGLLEALSTIATKYGAIKFRIKRFICVAGERDTTTDQLREQLGPEKKTVVFPEWRGCGYRTCNIKMRHKLLSRHRPKLLYTLEEKKNSRLNVSYIGSDLVRETADMYIENLNLTKQPYISVYIRIEKLLTRNSTFHIDKSYIKCCTSVLQRILANIKKRYKLSNVLFTTDLGKYGTDSCDSDCQQAGMDVLKYIERTNKIKVFNYDPNTTPQKIDNGGFASLVEMNMLARASRLITVGSGSFKEQLTRLYEKRNVNSPAYAICKELDANVLHDFVSFPSHCNKK